MMSLDKKGKFYLAYYDPADCYERLREFTVAEQRDTWLLFDDKMAKWRDLSYKTAQGNRVSVSVIQDEQGVIYGHTYGISADIIVSGVSYANTWMCDLYLSQKLHRKGMGEKLASHLVEHAPNVKIIGGNQFSRKMFSKMGWSTKKYAVRYRRIINNFNYYKKSGSGRLRKIKNIILSIYGRIKSKDYTNNFKFDVTKDFSDWINNFIEETSPKNTVVFAREPEKVRWICEGRPGREYKCIIAKHNDVIIGYAILTTRNNSTGLKEGLIIDIYSAKLKVEVLQALVQKSVQYFTSQKVDYVNTIASHPSLKDAYRHNGFLDVGRLNVKDNKVKDALDKYDWHITMFECDYGYR